jgi:hypothetical protein
MELPPDFDGDAPQTNQVLEDGTGTWALAAQDMGFLDTAPDECPRKSMYKALKIFLRLGKEERHKRQVDTLNFLQDFTQLSGSELAPHVVLRIAVAAEDKPAEDWYATHFLGSGRKDSHACARKCSSKSQWRRTQSARTLPTT